MHDYEKEVKLHKSLRKAERNKQTEMNEKMKSAEEAAAEAVPSGAGGGSGGVDTVLPGTKVRLDGLTDSEHFNGSIGTVVGFNAEKNNYIVNIEDSEEQIHADAPIIVSSLQSTPNELNNTVENPSNVSELNDPSSMSLITTDLDGGFIQSDIQEDGGGGDGENGGTDSHRKRAKRKHEELEAERLANRGKYVIELKFPWMSKSVYNVPILNMVPSTNAMKRLPWMG